MTFTYASILDQELPPVFGDAGPCQTAMRVAHQRLALPRARIESLTALHDTLAARLGAGPTPPTVAMARPAP